MIDNIKTLLLIVIVSLFAGLLVVTLSGCDVNQSQTATGGATVPTEAVAVEDSEAEEEEK